MTLSSKAALLFVVIVSVAMATKVQRGKRGGGPLGVWLGGHPGLYNPNARGRRGGAWPGPPPSVYDGKKIFLGDRINNGW